MSIPKGFIFSHSRILQIMPAPSGLRLHYKHEEDAWTIPVISLALVERWWSEDGDEFKPVPATATDISSEVEFLVLSTEVEGPGATGLMVAEGYVNATWA